MPEELMRKADEYILEFLSKSTELITQVALTNQNLSSVVKKMDLHNQIIYGDSTGNGGLLQQAKENRSAITDHEQVLEKLENSCTKVVEFMIQQNEMNKTQSKDMKNLSRVVFGLAGIVMLIFLLIGLADINSLKLILSNLHL